MFARVQRELLAVLKARAEQTHPVLLTSRWHPRDIWKLDPVLEDYLVSGFVTSVDMPGPAARLQYLRAQAGTAARNGRADAIETLARISIQRHRVALRDLHDSAHPAPREPSVQRQMVVGELTPIRQRVRYRRAQQPSALQSPRRRRPLYRLESQLRCAGKFL